MNQFTRSRHRLWFSVVAVLVALSALVLAACYPGDVNSITELDTVLTQFDTTHTWSAPATFFLWDTVLHREDTANPSNNIPVSRQFDSLILAEARAGLIGYGYTEVPGGDTADYVLVASVVAVKNYNVNIWYPGGWGCCGWGPGWGYYYPPRYSVSSYATGSLFLDMYDQQNPDSTAMTVPVPWFGTLNGVLGTVASLTQSRLTNGIRQAYAQSPYLKPQ